MIFRASREIAAPPSSVFAAFHDSERLPIGRRLLKVAAPANEELLDRLSAEVARALGG